MTFNTTIHGFAAALTVWVAVTSPQRLSAETREANATLRMPADMTGPIPQTLAETGAFADLETLTPEPGIMPFEINVALWSDGAHKRRWFSVPSNQTIGFSRDGFWSYPAGSVFIKHFELELTKGDPSSARRLETRFLVRTANGVYGLTYRWDDSQRNASLVSASGMNETFNIRDDDGSIRPQTWHYPTRNECMACHNPGAGYVLGFNTAQLNCEVGPDKINQIRALSDAGYFQSEVTNIHTMRALVAATNRAVSVEWRVRSYLSANCVHCHQPGTPCGNTFWNPRITNSLPQTGIVNGRALMTLGDPQNRIVTPGRPDQSVLFARVANLGQNHMPALCTGVLNTEAIQLLMRWIGEELTGYQTYAEWQLANFGSTDDPAAELKADPDGDGAPNYLEYLTYGNPLLATDAWRVSVRATSRGMEIRFPQRANRGYEVEWTSNLNQRNSWQALDVPDNRPFFSESDREAVVIDPDRDAPSRFYRVRVYEP